MTDTRIPRVPFLSFAKEIFDAPYALSIAVLPPKRAQALNAMYRNKTYVPNVLSFALSPHEGEIVLNIAEAKRQWKSGDVDGTWASWVALLVIHSMLHLNGMAHGRTMEKQLENILTEHKFRAKLSAAHNTHGTKHHHRN
jgi:rRNA maturation RNase YbeY